MFGVIIGWAAEYLALAVAFVMASQCTVTLDRLTDLSKDRVTPVALCDELNPTTLYGLIGAAATTILLLISGNWPLLLINIAYAVWITLRSRVGTVKLYDPVDVLQFKVLEAHRMATKLQMCFHIAFALVLAIMLIVDMVNTFASVFDETTSPWSAMTYLFQTLFSSHDKESEL